MMNKVGGGTGGDDANGSMRPLGSFCLVDKGSPNASGTGVMGQTPVADHYRIDNPMASKLNLLADCVCVFVCFTT
jgi:hypothetical protein